VNRKIIIFWDVTPYNLIERTRTDFYDQPTAFFFTVYVTSTNITIGSIRSDSKNVLL